MTSSIILIKVIYSSKEYWLFYRDLLIVFKKWSNPGLFLFIFVLFNNNFTEKLLTSAVFELGLSELKARALTTWPPSQPQILCYLPIIKWHFDVNFAGERVGRRWRRLRDVQHCHPAKAEGEQLQSRPWDHPWVDEHSVRCAGLLARHHSRIRWSRRCSLHQNAKSGKHLIFQPFLKEAFSDCSDNNK